MSSVLRQPVLDTTVRPLGAAGFIHEDPGLKARLAEAEESGYQRGLEDGAAGATDAVERSRARAVESVASAALAAREELRSAAAETAECVVDLAIEVAELIVSSVPDELRHGLSSRVREALDALDDDLTVRCHPDDLQDLSADLTGTGHIALITDNSIGVGEAVISGRWGRADLTLSALFARVKEALGA